jgi:hypothetical protein
MAQYQFRQFYIPERMMPGLLQWFRFAIPPGEFLQAVLRNDLMDACGRADDENMRNLPAYCAFLYNVAPRGSHGSREACATWKGLPEWMPE